MVNSVFLDYEYSKEDFIKLISDHKANLTASLKYLVSPDGCGCQPCVYDEEVTNKAVDCFNDLIVNGVWRYANNNNISVATLTRHDVYTRPATTAEGKIEFQRMMGMLSQEDIDRYRWTTGSPVLGMLLSDSNGDKFDFDTTPRVVKSIFNTSLVPIKSMDAIIFSMDSLVEDVNNMAYAILLNNNLEFISGDYRLFIVRPDAIISSFISQSKFLFGYNGYTGFLTTNQTQIMNKTLAANADASKSFIDNIHRELAGYDKQMKVLDKTIQLSDYLTIDLRDN